MTDARQNSLFEELRIAKLLDETFERVLNGEDKIKVCRWLGTKLGHTPAESTLRQMVRKHGWGWRLEQSEAQAREEKLPPDMDAAAAQALRRRRQILTMEALTAKELLALHQMEIAERRVELETRRTKVAEKTLAGRIEKDRMTGAQWILEVLGNMTLLEQLRTQDESDRKGGLSEAVRIRHIMDKVWGSGEEGEKERGGDGEKGGQP